MIRRCPAGHEDWKKDFESQLQISRFRRVKQAHFEDRRKSPEEKSMTFICFYQNDPTLGVFNLKNNLTQIFKPKKSAFKKVNNNKSTKSAKSNKALETQKRVLKDLWRLTQHYVAAVASSTTTRLQVAAQVLTMRQPL